MNEDFIKFNGSKSDMIDIIENYITSLESKNDDKNRAVFETIRNTYGTWWYRQWHSLDFKNMSDEEITESLKSLDYFNDARRYYARNFDEYKINIKITRDILMLFTFNHSEDIYLTKSTIENIDYIMRVKHDD